MREGSVQLRLDGGTAGHSDESRLAARESVDAGGRWFSDDESTCLHSKSSGVRIDCFKGSYINSMSIRNAYAHRVLV